MAGKKQLQHLRAARLAKRLKTEAKDEEEYLPEELIARVDVSEEQEQLAENASDSDLDSDSEDSETNLQSGCIRAIGKLLIKVNGNMYLAFVITWLPFLEFNCYFRKVTKRGYLHFQCNSKGLSYKLTILHLAGFNSP